MTGNSTAQYTAQTTAARPIDARRNGPPILALGMPFLLGSYLLAVNEAVIPALALSGVFVLLLLGREGAARPASGTAGAGQPASPA